MMCRGVQKLCIFTALLAVAYTAPALAEPSFQVADIEAVPVEATELPPPVGNITGENKRFFSLAAVRAGLPTGNGLRRVEAASQSSQPAGQRFLPLNRGLLVPVGARRVQSASMPLSNDAKPTPEARVATPQVARSTAVALDLFGGRGVAESNFYQALRGDKK